ncbi:MAG: MOSC domain-containing protein [Rhodospirillales bacterium]
MQARLERIVRYPVKGMAGEALEEAKLASGRPLPDDRRYALAYGSAAPGQEEAEWLAQAPLVDLIAEERLAALGLAYDAESAVLTLMRDGRQVARAQVDQPLGQTLMNQFFAAYLKDNPRGTARFVEAPDDAFTYWDEHFLHAINLATARDLERVAREPVDPRRFRANLWLDGVEAWAEMNWVGRRLRIGEALLEVADKTERCAVTMVNPDSAKRDLNIPRTLRAGYGHLDMGVYLRVVEEGAIKPGDTAELLAV